MDVKMDVFDREAQTAHQMSLQGKRAYLIDGVGLNSGLVDWAERDYGEHGVTSYVTLSRYYRTAFGQKRLQFWVDDCNQQWAKRQSK